MNIRAAIVAGFSATALSFASLAPATAAEPGPWLGGYALGHFGLGALFVHPFLGLAALPLAIAGAVAAQSQNDRSYAPAPSYAPTVNYGQPSAYAPPPGYYTPPSYYSAPSYYPSPRYYVPPNYYPAPAAGYAPRAVYYSPAPRYYAPPVSYYGRPAGYYGARPGYYAPSGYQAARRSGNYHYSR